MTKILQLPKLIIYNGEIKYLRIKFFYLAKCSYSHYFWIFGNVYTV